MANNQLKFDKHFKNLAALYFYFISVSSHFPMHGLAQRESVDEAVWDSGVRHFLKREMKLKRDTGYF